MVLAGERMHGDCLGIDTGKGAGKVRKEAGVSYFLGGEREIT